MSWAALEQIDIFPSVRHEVVDRDIYKLQSLVFPPDVIFDIGANMGAYTHYAHERFPEALVVAVEPHPANFAVLHRYAPPTDRVVLLNLALGNGPIYRYPDVTREAGQASAGESYVSTSGDYQIPDLEGHPLEAATIPGILLDELRDRYVQPGQRYVFKLDCEGAENLAFQHGPSVVAMQEAEFVAMELHPYWASGAAQNDHAALAVHVAALFQGTHRWDSEPPMFYAWRAPEGEPVVARGEFGKFLAARGLLGHAAEIGVCSGSYSRDILDWGVQRLYLVDPWRELPDAPCGISDAQHEAYYQETLTRLTGVEERATILRMLSVEAAQRVPDGSLDFCYIDANHRYEGISVDLPTWWPKVRPGGILAGHDFLEPSLGVNRAVKEFAAQQGLSIHLVIEHQRDASFWLEKPCP